MSRDEEIRRGQEAERILDDPLIKEALFNLKATCLAEWEKSPARDTDGRERLWLMYRTAQDFEKHFRTLVEGGKIASALTERIDRERKAPTSI